MTTRGFKEAECRELAGWICDILADLNNDAVIDAVRAVSYTHLTLPTTPYV